MTVRTDFGSADLKHRPDWYRPIVESTPACNHPPVWCSRHAASGRHGQRGDQAEEARDSLAAATAVRQHTHRATDSGKPIAASSGCCGSAASRSAWPLSGDEIGFRNVAVGVGSRSQVAGELNDRVPVTSSAPCAPATGRKPPFGPSRAAPCLDDGCHSASRARDARAKQCSPRRPAKDRIRRQHRNEHRPRARQLRDQLGRVALARESALLGELHVGHRPEFGHQQAE